MSFIFAVFEYTKCEGKGMWSNEISIDKKYEREIDFIISKLEKAKDLSYALEESEDRVWIYLASVCERQEQIEEWLASLVETVILTFMKIRFFVEKLGVQEMTTAKCILICSLAHFDKEFERTVVRKVLSNALDYNLDGLLNFRLRALKDEWQELASVAKRLLGSAGSEEEVYDISSFITGSDAKKCRLVINGEQIKNVTEHSVVEVVDVFGDDEYNFINSIIENRPGEIVVENFRLPKTLAEPLRKIARVIDNNI
ncbi:MAG: hypothetical protein IJ226_02965 [Clostridia bacterium]|nr:hypothetical protein [Clostridia bacterium]